MSETARTSSGEWSLVSKTQTKEESDLQCSQVQRQVCNSNCNDEVFNYLPEEVCSNMPAPLQT